MDQKVTFPFEINPEIITFGFVARGTTPSNFLQWLSENEISASARGYLDLASVTKKFNDAGGDYDHPTIGKRGYKKITFRQVEKIAGLNSSSKRAEFDNDCVWIRFDLEDFSVMWTLFKEQKKMASVDVSVVRKNLLAALKFFFKTINNPEYAPVSQLSGTV